MAETSKPQKPKKESDLERLTRENLKKDWLERFTGATLNLNVNFGSPLVQHMYKRVFDITGRNAYYIQNFARILGAGHLETVIVKCEEHVLNTIRNARKDFENKFKQLDVVIKDAGIDTMATFNAPETIHAKIVSPIQREFLRAMEDADKLMALIETLWLETQIKEDERSKFQREIKYKLRNCAGATRNMFNHLRKRIGQLNNGEAITEADLEIPEETDVKANGAGKGSAAKPKKVKPTDPAANDVPSIAPVITHALEPAAAAGG